MNHLIRSIIQQTGRLSFVCFVLGALASNTIWAQTTAQISGAVRDSTGAVLPGVEVSATQTATGAKRTVVTNETGYYSLPSLAVGPYMVEATLPGFRTYVQTGIVLQVGGSPTINISLEVGQVTETVEVEADAALVETRSVGVGTVIDNTRVLEMPLNGRNVTELIFLAGMATTGNSGFLNSVRNYPTVNISVTGGVANWTQYNFDGTAHNDAYNSLNLPLPFPDALQEFKVESSALQAQYGVHASANVNVITKAGTNEYHGSAFEFVRNGIFNARNAFAPKRDTLKRNQFGGVFGGPIVKNKLFFFGGYQGTIQRSEPSQNIAWVPTAQMLRGDFTTIASPACNGGKQITLLASQGFVDNTISPSSFNPAAVKFTTRLPVDQADACGKVNYGLKSNQAEHMEVARVDYTKSDRNSWFTRFFVTDLEIPTTFDGKNALTMNANAQDDRVYALSIGNTFLISQNIVSSFRVGANRSKILKITDKLGTWPEFGVNAPYAPDTEPRISVTGGNGFAIGSGSSIINYDIGGPNPSATEDISWARGSHQIGLGATWSKSFLNYGSGVNASGNMTFDGSATGGLGLADFLLGKVRQWNQGNVQAFLVNRQAYFGAYIQDSWKASSRVTVNYGIRYEPYTAFTNKRGWFSHFDESRFDQGLRSSVYVNSPPGFIYPGDPEWTPGGKRVAHNRWNIFLPRLGIVWDPEGNGNMSIRASVGMFTDRGALYSMSAMAQDAPYGSNIAIPNVNMSEPWASYPGGNPLPFTLNKNYTFPAFGAFVTTNLHWHPTWVNQFNLSIQKSFKTDWLIAANYVGNTTSHLINAGQINPAVFMGLNPCTINTVTGPVNYPVCSTTGNTNQRRRLSLKDPIKGQYFGILSVQDDGGTGSYNALYLQTQKRMSHGLSILTNYTWSHCIADLWNGNPGNTGGSAVTPGDRKADRSNCDANQGNDQRHILNVSAVLQTPQFANRTLGMIAGNWQFSPILKIRSGTFFTMNTGVDTALNGEGGANQRPNFKGGNPYAANKTVDGWLNRDAFENPAPGTLGNYGRNNLSGPGTVQIDVALSRTFNINEKQTIQLRAEAFNLPNHLNLSNPVSALNSASFGKIQSDVSGTSGLSPGNQRIMQFALKYVF